MNATGAPPGGRAVMRQTVWITVGALAAYVGIRSLPVDRGGLHYDDFGVGRGGPLEFCEPGGPQFVPVEQVRSPVSLSMKTADGEAPRAGVRTTLVLRMTSASGKPVMVDDLLVSHTQKLHLLVIDPSLEDYQHLHPAAGAPGEYTVAFTPRCGGDYRIFADFVPRATGRALYAGARLVVEGGAAVSSEQAAAPHETRRVRVGDYDFVLQLDREPPRINEVVTLQLQVLQSDGSPAPLEEIMGAKAHVVAFDEARSGFAHLHPISGTSLADPIGAPLDFQLNLTEPGTYRLWAQVIVGGHEQFAPFVLSVSP